MAGKVMEEICDDDGESFAGSVSESPSGLEHIG